MNDVNQGGNQKRLESFGALQPRAAVPSMAQNKPIQTPTAPRSDMSVTVQPPAQQHAPDSPAPVKPKRSDSDFSISVDQARERLAAVGLKRSKDTIQRYCRDGTLAARKLGMFGRFFITTDSLDAFLKKIKHDAGAGSVTVTQVQPHEVATGDASTDMQEHEDASEGDVASDQDLHEAAPEDAPPRTQRHEGATAGAHTRTHLHEPAPADNAAVLQAKLDAAHQRITDQKQTIDFLMEEVKDARGNRRDVTTIAERMLGTLEAMALGGRLESSSTKRDAPVQAEVIRGGGDEGL